MSNIDSSSDLIMLLGSHSLTSSRDIKKVPEIAACVNLRSRLASKIPLFIYNDDIKKTKHYLQAVLNKPSPDSTLSNLVNNINRDMLLNRYCLVKLIRNTSNKTIAIKHININDWKMVDIKKQLIEVTEPTRLKIDIKNQPTTGDYYVLFDHHDNLIDNLMLEIEEYVMIKTSRVARLRNTPDVSMVIDMSKSADVKDPLSLTPQQLANIEKNRREETEKCLGPQNVGKVLMTFGTPVMVNAGVKESDFNESIKQIKSTICSIFGMSLADLGYTENVNLNNAQSMHAHLYETVVTTDIEMICQQLTIAWQTLGELDEKFCVYPDYSEVAAFQQIEEYRVKLKNDELDLINKQIDTITKMMTVGYTFEQCLAILKIDMVVPTVVVEQPIVEQQPIFNVDDNVNTDTQINNSNDMGDINE